MVGLTLILIGLAAIEIPLWILLCRKFEIHSFGLITTLGILFYLLNDLAIASVILFRNGGEGTVMETMGVFLFFAFYGAVIFAPLFLPVILLVAWRESRIQKERLSQSEAL